MSKYFPLAFMNSLAFYRYGNIRKSYDMMTAMEDESNAYTTVFPIPSRAIDLNPALKQNPGYIK